MKVGDTVISLGDPWIGKGSVGKINKIKNKQSVYVIWHSPQSKPKVQGTITQKYLPNVGLYHNVQGLKVIEHGSADPNVAFMHRKINRR